MIINKPLVLTYLYLLIYILLSSGVILYNKVIAFAPFRFGAYLFFSFLDFMLDSCLYHDASQDLLACNPSGFMH